MAPQTPPAQLAAEAAAALGWNPQFVYKQWALETGNFTSKLWVTDNNPAGIKWYPGMTYGTQGSPAPDGGYYARFADPVQGYVQFVKSNPRYSAVGSDPTVAGEAQRIQAAGWATDPNYAAKIVATPGPGPSGTSGTTDTGTSNAGGFAAPSWTRPVSVISASLYTLLGIGVVLLGIWILFNPLADISSAIRSAVRR